MTAVEGPYVVGLDEASQNDVSLVGSKAATLGDLIRAGHRVPDGFVLTTRAFERFVQENDLKPGASAECVSRAPVPREIVDVLFNAAGAFGASALAVRSSAMAEDLHNASFAGQYETVLGVRGDEALLKAVRQCWASAFGESIALYKGRVKDRRPGMAVVVQRLVEADAAGVAFTAHPVTGDRSETVVNAVRGLGDRLVSGKAIPDEWVVNGSAADRRGIGEPVLDACQARAIADVARQVEAQFGAPQDVEWAIAGDRVFLLQARPITALPEAEVEPVPVPVEPPPGYWQREASHAPLPWSPMNRSLFFETREAATKRWCDEFGLLFERIAFCEIGGWEYVRPVPLGGKDRRPPPTWLMRVLIRVMPRLRSRLRSCVEAARSDRASQLVDQWYHEWMPALGKRAAELADVDLTPLSDDDLEAHLDRIRDLLAEGIEVHAVLHGAEMVALADLAFTCRDVLGWDEGAAFEMLSGLSGKSTEPAQRLVDLARMAKDRPAVMRLLEDPDEDTPHRLASTDSEFSEALSAYHRTFARRALRYEVADPSMAEEPALVLRLIRDQLARGYDPSATAAALDERRYRAVAAARSVVSEKSARDRIRFETALARAQRAYPVREENEFYTISAPLAVVRSGLLELGRRLTARGVIASRDDVFFLEMDEARGALRAGISQQDLLRRRKGERAWVLAHPGPPSYGRDPGLPPSFAALPPEARFVHEALMWVMDRMGALALSGRRQTATGVLDGIAASPGRYSGPARVIRSEAEFHKLRAGDVLVCPVTSPVWSVLFPSIGALVTDSGGILSHPAIIAREYGVPAVLATGNATALLRDGQQLEVNGTEGRVRLLQSS